MIDPPSLSITVREERPEDHEVIREVNRLAFGNEGEGRLIDRLREEGRMIVSLVALEGEGVVGHILFSELPIETREGVIPGASLAPMAVLPERQNRGIGSALVERGLALCREGGVAAVVVLGHPPYYPRFGFSAEAARNLEAPFSGEAFMALELTPGALLPHGGKVSYPEAFFEVE